MKCFNYIYLRVMDTLSGETTLLKIVPMENRTTLKRKKLLP